jgi:hypothetical protein
MNINITISAVTLGYTNQMLSVSFKNFKNPYSTKPLKIFNVTVVGMPVGGHDADWEDSDFRRERVR